MEEGGNERQEELELGRLIFRKKNITKLQKVTNQPKHYFRMFKKKYMDFLRSSFYNKDEIKQIKKVINNLNYKSSREAAYKKTMEDMEKLLSPKGPISAELAKKNRHVLQKILHSDMCTNSGKGNRLAHMLSSRIYSLRCIDRALIKRNEIH